MAEVWSVLYNIFIFPGFLFLSVFSLFIEFVDRKLYARLQNRMGPPWFQPLADFIKLVSKEVIIPTEAQKGIFKIIPIFALAAVTTAFMYIPVWGTNSLFPFKGDVIVVLYLLTIPTLTFFIAGWHSTSLFSELGAIRTLTQLFAYEVPLFMAVLAPALLAGDPGEWSISKISLFFNTHPVYLIFNIPAFIVALIAMQGKLERVPFDMPEAETEIVAGTFTEYSGRLLAVFRMAIDIEMVVVAALLASIFFPFFVGGSFIGGFILFIVKILIITFLLAVFRTAMARLRIEQMVDFCWRYLTPTVLIQIVIDVILKGVIKI